MKQVYQLIFNLGLSSGGKTSALLSRSKYFNENNLNSNIVTFDYNSDYDFVLEQLRESKRLDYKTKVYNQFSFFENRSLSMTESASNINKNIQDVIDDCVKIAVDKNKYALISLKNGEYRGNIKYNSQNKFVLDLFKNNYRVRRVYASNGLIKRIKEFDYNGILNGETFYNQNGQPFLRRSSKDGSVSDLYLIAEKKYFKNNIKLGEYFLEQLIEDTKNNIIISDGTGSINKLVNNKQRNVQKYAVMHTNHKNSNGIIKEKEENILKNSHKLDGVIFLTQEQIDDVEKEYGITNAHLIYNFISNIPEHYGQSTNKIVGNISRLVKGKGFDLLTDVAKKVKEIDPEITFHIYGEGDYKDEILKMIDEKNLNSTVKLFGYTDNPYKTIKGFRSVISTSQSEAQGLSMIEAMANGVPVVAFDIKYGPSQFIKDEINGKLIENKNVNAMATAIIELMNNDSKSILFGEYARKEIIESFEPINIINQWKNLFDK